MEKTQYFNYEINGCKLSVYPMESVRAACMEVYIRCGSAYEGKDWGAFHLLEHMMHQGSNKFPTRMDAEVFKEEHGISQGASTGRLTMTWGFKFPENALDQTLTLFDEFLFNSLIPQSRLEREVNVIKQEYIDKWSNPYNRFGKEVSAFIHGPGHTYTRDGMGQPDFIATLTAKDLLELRNKFVAPPNMLIAVAGNINPDTVYQKIKTILETKPVTNKSKLIINPSLAHSKQERFIWHKEDMDQSSISLTWLLPGADKLTLKNRIKIGVINYLLSSSRGPLIRTLREEHGLVYKAGSRRINEPTLSEFEVWASTNKENLPKVYQSMQDVVKDFLSNQISDEIFNRGKKFMNIQTLMGYDAVSAIASQMVNSLYWHNRVIPPEEYIETASGITEKQARTFVAKYILNVKPHVAVMSKEETKLE